MTGKIVIRQTLTNQLLDEIQACGFKLDIQVDCSQAV